MNERIHTQSLQNAIERLFDSSPADFIEARDRLAKELRSAGEREDAAAVKRLRKPSRTAWALNRVARGQPENLAALETAVADLVDAQAGNGDIRGAMAGLRTAIRDYATRAAEESRTAGYKLDLSDLSNAILAILGSPSSFGELRTGRLTDVPEAGGLDFLTGFPGRPQLEVSSAAAESRPAVATAEAAAAQEQARQAAQALQAARDAVEAAAAALVEAEAEVSAAQDRFRSAESELRGAMQRREFARRAVETANAELSTAEAARRAGR